MLIKENNSILLKSQRSKMAEISEILLMLKAAHGLIFKHINSLLTCLSYHHMCQVAELCHWPGLPSKHKCVPRLLLAAAVPAESPDPGTPRCCQEHGWALLWDRMHQLAGPQWAQHLWSLCGPNLLISGIRTKETFVFVHVRFHGG